jgi:hypothetical protein
VKSFALKCTLCAQRAALESEGEPDLQAEWAKVFGEAGERIKVVERALHEVEVREKTLFQCVKP